MAEPFRRSPLQHRSAVEAEAGAVRLADLPFLGKFVLRADKNAAVEPLRAALGLGLPFDALTSSTDGETSFLWLGPDEWMLVTAPDDAGGIGDRVRQALSGIRHQLVSVGNYYTVIEIAGPKAREALMKLTTLDLHPGAFRAGMVAGSMFARTQATLWQVAADDAEGGPVFRLVVRWSMADYLWCVLADAAREWGMPEQQPVDGERLTID